MSNKLHVKKDDTVLIISGDDKGKQGKVLEVSPKEGKVIVEKANMVIKHVKPRRQGEAGGRVEAEGAIYASKVQVVCPKCKTAGRMGHTTITEGDKKVTKRVCKNKDCGEIF